MKRSILATALSTAFAISSSTATAAGDEAAVIVTASRFEQLTSQLPVGATIITARDLARSSASTLPEALGQLGGVHLRNNSGDPSPQVDLRGFGATGDQNTLILVDGLRISENELASARLSAIPLDAIERIEILPGAGAVLYGGGATAGTINIVTRKPHPGERKAAVTAALGEHATRLLRGGASIAGERVGFSVNANDTDTDNYRRNNALKEQNLNGSLRLFGDRAEGYFNFGSGRTRLGLPGPLTEAQIAADPRQTTNPLDRLAVDTGYATLGGSVDLGGNELAMDAGWRNRRSDSFAPSFGGGSTTAIDTDVRSLTPRLRLPYALAGRDGSLVLGADWYHWDYRRRLAIPAFFFNSDIAAEQSDRAFYAYNQLQLLSTTRLTTGVRWHRSSITQQERAFVAAPQSLSRSLSAFELGLRHALDNRWSIWGRWGQSFRVANVDDNGFTGTGNLLEPQKSHDGELGVEYAAQGQRARLSVFESRVNNEIHFIAIPAAFFFNGFNTNLPPTRHRGVEADGSWTVTPAVTLSANYRYTMARFREGVFFGSNVAGNEVPLVPRHRASLGATWQISDATRLNAGLRYVGRQRYDNDQVNTFHAMPAYTLVDLKLSHLVGKWTLSAQADNLFDRKYYSYAIVPNPSVASFQAYPESGRRVLLSAGYAFE